MDNFSEADKQARMNALYHTGPTTTYASGKDPRFCYTLYVPYRFASMDHTQTRIIVSVHGTGRMQTLYRDLFADFAEYNNCIVLAPLFPANILGDGNMSGYKYIQEGDIRYDRVILDMIDEVAGRYGVDGQKVMMFGFSGGGHFTHRFTILHPQRILAASVGSPGSVTMLDHDKPWWAGVRDCEEKFGISINKADYKSLPMHFVVGGADLATWEITFEPGDKYYVEGANDAGRDRGERIKSLAASFEKCGAKTRLDVVEDVTHDVVPVSRMAREFFLDVLTGAFPA